MSKKNCRASSKHKKALKRKSKLAKRNKKSIKKSNMKTLGNQNTLPMIPSIDPQKLEDTFSVLLLDYCPIKTSLVFSSLMLKAECHSIAHSLESAIKLCLSFCKGKSIPDKKLISSIFIKLDELGISLMNDPAEDVLVSTLWFNGSPHKVLTGLWDGAIYQAQNLINIVENNSSICSETSNIIQTILQASNLVISKSNLSENELGNMSAHKRVSEDLLDEVIGSNYLDDLFIGSHETIPVLDHSSFSEVYLQPFGSCDLEEKPFCSNELNQYLLLPNLIPLCIKRVIISRLRVSKTTDFIDHEYYRAISNNLSHLRLFREFLGSKVTPVSMKRIDDGWYSSEFAVEFDKGYIFHFVFLIQSSQTLDSNWFNKTVDIGETASEYLYQSIIKAKSNFLDN